MTRPQNSYIAGNPISDQDRFIGRADVMRETLRVLRNPNTNAIVLHGSGRSVRHPHLKINRHHILAGSTGVWLLADQGGMETV